MKANIKSAKKNDSDILLSIGMIVKNEEKVLRRCLESLKPLMEAISCELIIADTGSTDSTVEIAKEYTDNVFDFEWINDFAAARNSTLKKARGQWYMYVDADEYLDDDIGEMIHFFKIPELCSKYKTIQINVRSYNNEEKTKYQDCLLSRFQRIDDPDDPVEFTGSVHETIYTRFPLGYFSTILHHTGYCFSSVKQDVDKKIRNLAIMKEEYKKTPDDMRLLCHIIDGTFKYPVEIEKYISEALALVRKNRFDIYGNAVYILAVQYYENARPMYALELCQEYQDTLPDYKKYVGTLDILLAKANILSSISNYEEAYETFEKYFKLYKDYKDDKLDISDLSCHPISGVAEHEYISSLFTSLLCLKELRRYDEAIEILSKIDVKELKDDEYRNYLGTLREICKDKKEYTALAKFYSLIINNSEINNIKEKISLALFMLESAYYSLVTPVERQKFAMDMVNSGYSGKYIELMKLILSQETPEFKQKLVNFVNSIDDWTDGYSEAVYLAVKHKVDISCAVQRMDPSVFREKLEEIAINNDDFAGYVCEYGMPESYMTDIKLLYWLVSLYEKASNRSFELNDEKKFILYSGFTSLLSDYVVNIYNADLLNDDDICVLPVLHKFGYFMYKAQNALYSNDKVGYIKEMKNGLKSCGSMHEIVRVLLEHFKKENCL